MAKFNVSKTGSRKTYNYEGGSAYKLSSEMELYTTVCACLLKDKFYETERGQLERIKKLITEVSPEFVAKLGVYAREQMYLRSIPMVLAVELARVHKGDNLVSRMVYRIIQRADELTEILAYYQKSNKRTGIKKLNKLSKQIQKGIKAVFESDRFDQYRLQKYNRAGEVTLKDALFLTHPNPQNEDQAKTFKELINDTLPTPITWETQLSTAKDREETKKEVWERLIDDNKIPYMACIRNCRNILDAGVSLKHINKVANYICNEKAVRYGKQMPFRYLSAYIQLMNNSSPYVSPILEALNKAIWLSVDNLGEFTENDTVLIASDDSGSMTGNVTPSIKYYELGVLMAILLRKKCKYVTLGLFSDSFRIKQIPKNENVLDAVKKLTQNLQMSSTNGYKVIEYLNKSQYDYNKVYVFTDMQLWDSEAGGMGYFYRRTHDSKFAKLWREYKTNHPKTELCIIDLAGYGHSPVDISNKDVYLIAGFSPQVFQMIESLKEGNSALKRIKSIEL